MVSNSIEPCGTSERVSVQSYSQKSVYLQSLFRYLTSLSGVKREGPAVPERSPESKKPRIQSQPNASSPDVPASPPKPVPVPAPKSSPSKPPAISPQQSPMQNRQVVLLMLERKKAEIGSRVKEIQANSGVNPAQHAEITKLMTEYKTLQAQLNILTVQQRAAQEAQQGASGSSVNATATNENVSIPTSTSAPALAVHATSSASALGPSVSDPSLPSQMAQQQRPTMPTHIPAHQGPSGASTSMLGVQPGHPLQGGMNVPPELQAQYQKMEQQRKASQGGQASAPASADPNAPKGPSGSQQISQQIWQGSLQWRGREHTTHVRKDLQTQVVMRCGRSGETMFVSFIYLKIVLRISHSVFLFCSRLDILQSNRLVAYDSDVVPCSRETSVDERYTGMDASTSCRAFTNRSTAAGTRWQDQRREFQDSCKVAQRRFTGLFLGDLFHEKTGF